MDNASRLNPFAESILRWLCTLCTYSFTNSILFLSMLLFGFFFFCSRESQGVTTPENILQPSSCGLYDGSDHQFQDKSGRKRSAQLSNTRRLNSWYSRSGLWNREFGSDSDFQALNQIYWKGSNILARFSGDS